MPCVTTVGTVGQSFSSAAHRAAEAASMGALHSMEQSDDLPLAVPAAPTHWPAQHPVDDAPTLEP
eukprot:2098871-Prymnesium_polylepis.1